MFKRSLNFKVITSILLLSTLLLIGCSSVRAPELVYVTDKAAAKLLSPGCVGEPFESYQLVTGSFSGRDDVVMECYVKMDQDSLELVAMARSGQTFAEIVYDGEAIHFSSPFVNGRKVKCEYVLLDLQYALYESGAVKESVEGIGLSYEETIEGDAVKRTIFDGGSVVWSMERSGSTMSVKNVLRDYEYTIEALL